MSALLLALTGALSCPEIQEKGKVQTPTQHMSLALCQTEDCCKQEMLRRQRGLKLAMQSAAGAMKAARNADKVSANGLRALGSLLAATNLGNGDSGEVPKSLAKNPLPLNLKLPKLPAAEDAPI